MKATKSTPQKACLAEIKQEFTNAFNANNSGQTGNNNNIDPFIWNMLGFFQNNKTPSVNYFYTSCQKEACSRNGVTQLPYPETKTWTNKMVKLAKSMIIFLDSTWTTGDSFSTGQTAKKY